MVWQPGVVGIVGLAANASPSMLYSTLKPATVLTVGKLNADAQVFAGAVIVGAFGKITTLTVLLFPHAPVPAVPARVVPQVELST
jgi:hypothetical protein